MLETTPHFSKYHLVENDLNAVRNEISELKKCQTNYAIIITTAPGLLLGINFIICMDDLNPFDLPFIKVLIPLLIILPIWCIFFDKSKSITRMQAYYMILEKLINHPELISHYTGFESANAEYRNLDRSFKKKFKNRRGFQLWSQQNIFQKIEFIFKAIIFRESSRYINILFIVFLAMSFSIILASSYLFLFFIQNYSNNLGFFSILQFIISIIIIFIYGMMESTGNEMTSPNSQKSRIHTFTIPALVLIKIMPYSLFFIGGLSNQYLLEISCCIVIDTFLLMFLIIFRYNTKIFYGLTYGIYTNYAYKSLWEFIILNKIHPNPID